MRCARSLSESLSEWELRRYSCRRARVSLCFGYSICFQTSLSDSLQTELTPRRRRRSRLGSSSWRRWRPCSSGACVPCCVPSPPCAAKCSPSLPPNSPRSTSCRTPSSEPLRSTNVNLTSKSSTTTASSWLQTLRLKSLHISKK